MAHEPAETDPLTPIFQNRSTPFPTQTAPQVPSSLCRKKFKSAAICWTVCQRPEQREAGTQRCAWCVFERSERLITLNALVNTQ